MKKFLSSILAGLLALSAVIPLASGADGFDASDYMHLTFESGKDGVNTNYGSSIEWQSGGFGGSS